MILITGGAGYLGGALSKTLLNLGYKVRVMDIVRTKYVPAGVEFIRADIRNNEQVKNALNGIEAVYHLAFVQTPSNLPEDVQRSVNVFGTQLLLDLCKDKNLKRFIFASTIEVYGSKPNIPISETDPLNPVGIYGIHKAECEELCQKYYREFGLPISIARLPLICGAGYYNHKVFLNIIDRVSESKPLFLTSPGNIMADMIHLNDALVALQLLLDKQEAIGEIFHFSALSPATHMELAQVAIRCTQSNSKIAFLHPVIVNTLLNIILGLRIIKVPKDQIGYLLYDFVCDNTKSENLLGYKPKWSVVEAMEALVAGYLSDKTFIKTRKIGEGLS